MSAFQKTAIVLLSGGLDSMVSAALALEQGFALHAHAADTLVVSARVGGATGPIGLFLVPRTAPGVRLKPAPADAAARSAPAGPGNAGRRAVGRMP